MPDYKRSLNYKMNRYFKTVFLSISLSSLCFGSSIEEADKVALKYCKQEYTYSGSLPEGYTGDVNKKMYLERMIELKDGKLMAYYSKDLIKRDLSMYEKFLSTGISWKGSKVSKEDEKKIKEMIKELEENLAVIEKHYPTDLEVYDRINKEKFKTSR